MINDLNNTQREEKEVIKYDLGSSDSSSGIFFANNKTKSAVIEIVPNSAIEIPKASRQSAKYRKARTTKKVSFNL